MKPTFYTLNHTIFRALLPAVLLFSTACEKVLDIDLKDADPKTVIEANVSDQPGPYKVFISRSVSFDDPNIFPAISNAQVTLSDNAGNEEVLTETEPGVYKSKNFQGVPARNYFLKVVANGQEFNAVSTMPQPMQIQKIQIDKFEFNPEEKVVNIYIQDPAGVRNYYRAFYYVNGVASDKLLYTDDEFNDGKLIEGTFIDDDLPLKSGDSVRIVLQTVDEKVFLYLREQDRLGNSQSASPANPTSNISNGSLGYFSAHAETSASIVVP
jgi:hypothetical protein